MGITELFGPRADLTRMSGSPLAESMKVSGVFHRATIEVNEGGSEASAASGNIRNCMVFRLAPDSWKILFETGLNF